jgi:bis(5'-nucleosyl)-tetraphosphatase (symmetrical)
LKIAPTAAIREMATYAVGDIQGCGDEFEALLDKLAFDPGHDRLWLVGDLINRGPQSLQVVRRVRALGDAAVTVLGNHDLHLLAIHYGGHTPRRGDTLDALLNAPDLDDICEWLRGLALMEEDANLGFLMTHAGVPHIWGMQQARDRAREVEAVIRGPDHREYFSGMYGDEPDCWDDRLLGMDRWRVITNYFTRMRLVDAQGRLDLTSKGESAAAQPGWYPWYQLRARAPLGMKLLFGHWAALRGVTGDADVVALDTGCVWGGALTALCLETGEFTSIPAV